MSNTEKNHIHESEKNGSNIKAFGHIDKNGRDLSCYFVGGTTIFGKSKPITALEPVSENHDEVEVLKFINELSMENKGNLIEPLWPLITNKYDLHCSSPKTAENIDKQKHMVELEPVSSVFPGKK